MPLALFVYFFLPLWKLVEVNLISGPLKKITFFAASHRNVVNALVMII